MQILTSITYSHFYYCKTPIPRLSKDLYRGEKNLMGMKNPCSWVRQHFSDLYLILTIFAALFYTRIFTSFSIEKHASYHSGLDLAIYEQLLWTTVQHGTFFYNTLEGMESFGVHFSPILFTLVPLYAIVPDTQTLFFIQTLLLASASVPLYLIGRHYLGESAGFIVALCYLMYPALHGVNLTDFHIICFAPVFFFSAFYGFVKKNVRLFMLFTILLMMVREDLIPVASLLSLYACWQTKKEGDDYRPYLLLAISGVIWFGIVMFVLMPSFIPTSHAEQIVHLSRYQGTIEGLGQNQEYRITHILLLFGPLLFLPIFSPGTLLTGISAFLEIFISPNPFYYSIEYQYSALIIPSIFTALVVSIAKMEDSSTLLLLKIRPLIIPTLLIIGIISMLLVSPSPIRSGPFKDPYQSDITEHHQIINSILESIPPESAIGTQDDLLPHLSRRNNLYRGYHDQADYIIAYNQTKFVSIFSDSADQLSTWPVVFFEYGITIFKNPDISFPTQITKQPFPGQT